MLKHIGYDGAYRDDGITINVILENPLECGFDPANLVFRVSARPKSNNCAASTLRIEDIDFYVLDESGRIYNTRFVSASKSPHNGAHETDGDESTCLPCGFIHTELRPEFLFMDLRVAFCQRGSERIDIIKLQNR